MTIMSFRFLLLLTVCGIVLGVHSQPEEKVQRRGLCLGLYGCRHLPGAWRRRGTDAKREIQRRGPSSLQRRSWDDFWNGAAVAGTAILLVGRNTEAEKRKSTNYLPRPEVVDRDVIQKRSHPVDLAAETERASHGGMKQDNYEDTDRALITRNNFAFALKKRGNERRKRINWWHAAGGAAAAVGVALLMGRDAAENAESKQERYIQERNQLVEPLADWLQKRDAYESPDSALVTRNNFDSAKKEKRIEALMQK